MSETQPIKCIRCGDTWYTDRPPEPYLLLVDDFICPRCKGRGKSVRAVVKIDRTSDHCFYLIPVEKEERFNELSEQLVTDWDKAYDLMDAEFGEYWYQPEYVRLELDVNNIAYQNKEEE